MICGLKNTNAAQMPFALPETRNTHKPEDHVNTGINI